MATLKSEEGYHLLIVGEFFESIDRYRAQLESLMANKQLTLVDRYVPNEEIPLYFSAADLVIAPYVSTSQSGVIQIAYGFSKPVIATKVGGIPESVIDGQTGYLVPPTDAHAIATAIRRYFDLDEKETFRNKIIQEREKNSWDRMVKTIEEIGIELTDSHKSLG